MPPCVCLGCVCALTTCTSRGALPSAGMHLGMHAPWQHDVASQGCHKHIHAGAEFEDTHSRRRNACPPACNARSACCITRNAPDAREACDILRRLRFSLTSLLSKTPDTPVAKLSKVSQVAELAVRRSNEPSLYVVLANAKVRWHTVTHTPAPMTTYTKRDGMVLTVQSPHGSCTLVPEHHRGRGRLAGAPLAMDVANTLVKHTAKMLGVRYETYRPPPDNMMTTSRSRTLLICCLARPLAYQTLQADHCCYTVKPLGLQRRS